MVYWSKGYTFTNERFSLGGVAHTSISNLAEGAYPQFIYFVALTSSTATSGLSIHRRERFMYNNGTLRGIYYVSKTAERTLIRYDKGELFDTIVSNESFQDNAVNGSYWYELVQ